MLFQLIVIYSKEKKYNFFYNNLSIRRVIIHFTVRLYTIKKYFSSTGLFACFFFGCRNFFRLNFFWCRFICLFLFGFDSKKWGKVFWYCVYKCFDIVFKCKINGSKYLFLWRLFFAIKRWLKKGIWEWRVFFTMGLYEVAPRKCPR